jgi:predicted nucleic acid-binding protein
MAVVISDASPLICLSALRQLDLLRLLYGSVLVPEAVWQEVTRAPSFISSNTPIAATDAKAAGWLKVSTPTNRPLVIQLETTLDPGEAEAIALAVENKPCLLLIDERDGRQVARALGVQMTGTLGILLRAKSTGHMAAIEPLIKELIQHHNFRLHSGLVERILAEAGERS